MRSKSTLLRVLAGKLTPTSGTLSVNGIAVRKPVPGMCAFVPQDDIMLSQLTVREAVEHAAFMRLPAAMSKRLKRRVAGRGLFDVSFNLIDSQLIAVLDLLDIEGIAGRNVGEIGASSLSGGQRKRVSIALELAALPSGVLLLDEPTSGLDRYLCGI